MRRDDLILLRPEGLYCPVGRFYIDPWGPVEKAVITHAHSDHARYGMGTYYTSRRGEPVLKWRLGEQKYRVFEFEEEFTIGDATVSFHPAGHVLGSSQIRVEAGGEVWVVSGDYKRQLDPTCTPFEVVRCDTFITECTFGLPVFRWPATGKVVQEIVDWRDECGERGEAAVIYCYALGKAQRLLAELNTITREPVFVHGAIKAGIDVYNAVGIQLLDSELISDLPLSTDFAGRLIIAPPSAAGSPWLRRFRRAQQGLASGWMQLRGNRRRRNLDRGFVLSDHVDWSDLLNTISETGAERVLATHGDTAALVRFLKDQGVQAESITTMFGEDD